MYRIVTTKKAEKELLSLPVRASKHIVKKIKELSYVPRPLGCKKLEGYDSLYRIRYADYRIIYDIQDTIKVVSIIKIGHRKDVYR